MILSARKIKSIHKIKKSNIITPMKNEEKKREEPPKVKNIELAINIEKFKSEDERTKFT